MYMNLIIGRTGSGKTAFARLLENLDMKKVKSYTTRPKRQSETDDDYHFISKSDLDNYQDKLALTTINQEQYFVTKDELLTKNIYVIDYQGAIDLAKQTPDITYHIIHILNPDNNLRLNTLKTRYYQNNPKKDNESDTDYQNRIETLISKRNISENKQFTELENLYKSGKLLETLPDNIDGYFPIENDLKDINSLKTQAFKISQDFKTRIRLCNMIAKSADYGITTFNHKGFQIKTHNPITNKTEIEYLPVEQFADLIYNEPKNLQHFIGSLLSVDTNLDKIYPDILRGVKHD